jgi:hypothetical protein
MCSASGLRYVDSALKAIQAIKPKQSWLRSVDLRLGALADRTQGSLHNRCIPQNRGFVLSISTQSPDECTFDESHNQYIPHNRGFVLSISRSTDIAIAIGRLNWTRNPGGAGSQSSGQSDR